MATITTMIAIVKRKTNQNSHKGNSNQYDDDAQRITTHNQSCSSRILASSISDLNESTDFLNRSSYKYSDPGSLCNVLQDTYDVRTENTNVRTHRGNCGIKMYNAREELEAGREQEREREEEKEEEVEEELMRGKDDNQQHGTDIESSSKYCDIERNL